MLLLSVQAAYGQQTAPEAGRLSKQVLAKSAWLAEIGKCPASIMAKREMPGGIGSEVLLRSLDLTDEMQATNGRSLRMRKMTLAPGGVLGLHSHKDRPAVSYFLQGEVTYHPTDKPDVVVGPGEGIAEGKATTHWAENRGKVPAVWIAVDIPK